MVYNKPRAIIPSLLMNTFSESDITLFVSPILIYDYDRYTCILPMMYIKLAALLVSIYVA